jgi:erythromycin esterase
VGPVLGVLAGTAGVVGAAAAQRPLNLDFEMPSVSGSDRPWGWTLGWSAFAGGADATFALDSLVRHGGERSLRITSPDSRSGTLPPSIRLQLPAGFALGRDVRLTAWATAEGLQGAGLLTLEAWKDREFAAADTASLVAARGSGRLAWTRLALAIRVPRDSGIHSVVIAAVLQGAGTVWFDDLELAIDGTAVTAVPPDADPPSAADRDWLAGHVTPLRDGEVGSGVDDSDLGLFADIVGDARIVALGESTHGTREFFLLKHRLLEFLVRKVGFTVFAIEANQVAVEKINRYVRGGDGSARDVMRALFAVWNTEEMLGLVEWMRVHNTSHPERPVRFAGYDMQDHRTPADTLRAFLERSEPTLVTRFDQLAAEYRAQRSSATPEVPDTTRARWSAQAETLWREVSRRRSAWLARASSLEDSLSAEWAVQAANLARQAARFNVALNSPERDSLMAANLDWALRTLAPGERAVVWAHDVHVSRGGDPALSFNGGAQMGAYLRRLYGDGYRAFSLLTFEGAYRAMRSFTDYRMIAAQAFPGPAGSLEGALHRLARPPGAVGFVVDLRAARLDDAAAWLRRPRRIRHVGYAAYDYGFELGAVLPLEFDGVFFVDRTTPSRPLN